MTKPLTKPLAELLDHLKGVGYRELYLRPDDTAAGLELSADAKERAAALAAVAAEDHVAPRRTARDCPSSGRRGSC